jgi:hypothetical protein
MPKLVVAASANYTLPTISDAPNGCIDDTWTATSTTNAPSARESHTAVWTGSEMIVWGGAYGGSYLNDGGRYNPTANNWSTVAANGAPAARQQHPAIWTGNEMIIWGGSSRNDGGCYNPAVDRWTAVTQGGAPGQRSGHTAVWTGKEMIIWGGAYISYFNDTWFYTPGKVMFLFQKL